MGHSFTIIHFKLYPFWAEPIFGSDFQTLLFLPVRNWWCQLYIWFFGSANVNTQKKQHHSFWFCLTLRCIKHPITFQKQQQTPKSVNSVLCTKCNATSFLTTIEHRTRTINESLGDMCIIPSFACKKSNESSWLAQFHKSFN